MKLLNLSNSSNKCLLDDLDYDFLNQWIWRQQDNGYVVRGSGTGENYHTIYLHKVLMPVPDHLEVDHMDLNKLNNQKYNLRTCTHTENMRNIPTMKIRSTSGYKGVSWSKKNNRWRARINVSGKEVYLGHFLNKEDAAKAYNEAAIKYFGAYARLNNVKEQEQKSFGT